MKKYIIPVCELAPAKLNSTILAGTVNNVLGFKEDASNSGLFDTLEDDFPEKDKDLWDDAYADEK